MAPYKSEAQRKKFHALLKEGKIKQATVDEFDKASKGKKLPEKVSSNKAVGWFGKALQKVKVIK